MTSGLDALLRPASVAVVGLSRDAASYSRRLLRFLHQFEYPGRVVGVTPNVAYIGQSGAAGGAMFDLLRERGLTPAVWVSTGNQVDIDVTEVTSHLLDDPAVDTVLVYLEATPEGGAWQRVCGAASRTGKQIIA